MGNTALHKAAAHGERASLEVIIAFGGDVAAQNSLGMTPSEVAAYNGHTDIVAALRHPRRP